MSAATATLERPVAREEHSPVLAPIPTRVLVSPSGHEDAYTWDARLHCWRKALCDHHGAHSERCGLSPMFKAEGEPFDGRGLLFWFPGIVDTKGDAL